MYRTLDTSTWDDPKVKSLDTAGKLLFVYLITNRHSHVSGIYYLPTVLIEHETGIKNRVLDTLLDRLSKLGLIRIDRKTEVIWVVRMLQYQGQGEKHERAAANNLATLHNSCLIREFIDAYPNVKRYVKIGYPIGYPTQDQVGTPEQEQEQEKEQEEPPLSPLEPALPDGFVRFWQAYPVHQSKKECVEWWRRHKPTDGLLMQMLEAIEKQKNWRKWKDGFTPHPLTWLNGERWSDEEAVKPNSSVGIKPIPIGTVEHDLPTYSPEWVKHQMGEA